MARLAELQEALHRLFRGEASVSATAEVLGCQPARLAIYADFVAAHVRDAVDKNYPVLASWLAPAVWDRLCAGYVASRPSTAWEVNRAAEGFAEYLDARRAGGDAALHPAHVVMAELEWEQYVAYMHPAVIPSPGEVDGWRLNPTVSALELPYDVLQVIADAGGDELSPATPLPEPDPTVVLLYRDPADHTARAERATPELLLAFKIAAEGIAVADAAAAAGQPPARVEAILGDAARRGLVIG